MTGPRPTRRWIALIAVAAVAGWSCIPEPEPEPLPPELHENFPLLGSHSTQNCDSCHVDGAAEQGLTPAAAPEYVTLIGTDCLGCHTDTALTYFPGGHMDGRTCSDGGGCHSTSDWCWKQVRADCGDPLQPPGPVGHSEPPLADVFPLEGPHAGSCGDCHAGDESNEVGGATYCDGCHEADRPVDHYPPPRDGAASEERGCKSCHAGEDANERLVVPSGWNTNATVHDFVWPHAVVQDWDVNPPVLRAQNDWATDCAGCHAPGQYQTYTCSDGCHSRQQLDGYSSLHANVTYSECNQCHPDGTQ